MGTRKKKIGKHANTCNLFIHNAGAGNFEVQCVTKAFLLHHAFKIKDLIFELKQFHTL